MTAADETRVVIRRRIRASREVLFKAWTTPESMSVWMCPGDVDSAEVSMDLRLGGALRIAMRARHKTHVLLGEFTVIDPPAKLSFTWTGGNVGQQQTLVTVEFFAITDVETELVLTHEMLPLEVRDNYRGGWTRIAELLDQHLQPFR